MRPPHRVHTFRCDSWDTWSVYLETKRNIHKPGIWFTRKSISFMNWIRTGSSVHKLVHCVDEINGTIHQINSLHRKKKHIWIVNPKWIGFNQAIKCSICAVEEELETHEKKEHKLTGDKCFNELRGKSKTNAQSDQNHRIELKTQHKN